MSSDRRVHRLLLSLFGAIFAGAAGTHALTPIFPELKEALGVDDGAVRLLTAVFTIGYAISGFVLGIVCDRLGRRRVLLPALAAYGVASAVLAFPPDWLGYGGVLAARLVGGLATGGISAAVLALTSDAVPYERRGRAMSFVLAGSFIAVVLGIPLASELAKVRLTAIFAVLAAVSFLALVVVAREAPPDEPHEAPESPLLAPLRALRSPGAPGALATTFLNTVAAFAIVTSLADHAVDRFDADLDRRSLLFLALGLASLPGAFLASLLSDRVGKRRSVLFALVGSLAATPLLVPPARFSTFLAAACVVALVQALRQGPFAAILTELAPERRRGALVGWNSAASGIGLALGTWAGGLAYAADGLRGDVTLALAALALSLVAFGRFVPRLDGPDRASSPRAPEVETDGPSVRRGGEERGVPR
ncbi:MAG: MFS transporter [Planctomycetota bacterium JB042]